MSSKELVMKAVKDAFASKKQVFVNTHPHTQSVDFYSYGNGEWKDGEDNDLTLSIKLYYSGCLCGGVAATKKALKPLYDFIRA